MKAIRFWAGCLMLALVLAGGRAGAADDATEKFNRAYRSSVRVFKLKYLPVETASQLVEPQLYYYALRKDVHTTAGASKEETTSIAAVPLRQSTTLQGDPNWTILKAQQESVAIDNRTNSLIISAADESMERITMMLQELDLPSEPSAEGEGAPKKTHIDVYLVKGTQGRAARTSETMQQRVERRNASESKRMQAALEKLSREANGNPNYVQIKDLMKEFESSMGRQPDAMAWSANEEVVEGRAVTDRDLKHYGLSAEDLELYNLKRDQLREVGHSSLDLMNASDMGRAKFEFSPEYRCELAFMDTKQPYFIVKAALIRTQPVESLGDGSGGRRFSGGGFGGGRSGATQATNIFDNTLYLEPGKPAVLGITNLQEVLILVVRTRGDEKPAGAEVHRGSNDARIVPQ